MKITLRLSTLLCIIAVSGCSIFETEDWVDKLNVDYSIGVEESGRLKREMNFSSSEDQTVESDIEFLYDGDRLVKKIYNDYNWNEPYILQKDSFIYENGKLLQMLHYFRRGAPTSPFVLSETTYWYYPDEKTKIEVTYEDDGELDDSVIYVYDGDFLTEEKHINHLGTWGTHFEYNSDGKLFKIFDIEDSMITINYFDENGLLEKTVAFEDEKERSVITYDREITGEDQVLIRCYLLHKHLNWAEPKLTSHKKFENGKMVEFVNYHPTFEGAEWWCVRYEYY